MRHPPLVQHISPVRDVQRPLDVMLHHQNSRPQPVADFPYLLKHLFHHDWRKPQRRLVQQQCFRCRHQASAQRQHLLLPSRHLARKVAPLPVKYRKQLHHRIKPYRLLPRVIEIQASHLQVLLNRQMSEHPPALRHERNPFLHDFVRSRVQRLPAPKHLAAHDRRKPHDRLQRGGLPSAVRPHHRDNLALAHPQRRPVQRDDRIIMHRYVNQFQQIVSHRSSP